MMGITIKEENMTEETQELQPFAATMRRNPVYAGRGELRENLREALRGAAKEIIDDSPYEKGGVSGRAHIANIKKLQERVTEQCGCFLADGKLRFGAAQKYLNVELKRRWRKNKRKHCRPPHCPFDWDVIKRVQHKLGDDVCFKWTECDHPKCYKAWVRALRDSGLLGQEKIADWEDRYWDEEQDRKRQQAEKRKRKQRRR